MSVIIILLFVAVVTMFSINIEKCDKYEKKILELNNEMNTLREKANQFDIINNKRIELDNEIKAAKEKINDLNNEYFNIKQQKENELYREYIEKRTQTDAALNEYAEKARNEIRSEINDLCRVFKVEKEDFKETISKLNKNTKAEKEETQKEFNNKETSNEHSEYKSREPQPFIYKEYHQLHGIYHEHFGCNPQNVLPHLRSGRYVELKAINDNSHDKYAVAVFYENMYIGWIPAEENLSIHNMLNYEIPVTAYVNRLYYVSHGLCAEICVAYTVSWENFNPVEYKKLYSESIPLTKDQKLFLEYLDGKITYRPIINKKWFWLYGLNYQSEAILYIIYGYLTTSTPEETLEKLTRIELSEILKENGLPYSGNKSMLIDRICNNISKEKIVQATSKKPAHYILTSKGKRIKASNKCSQYFIKVSQYEILKAKYH